MITTEELQAQLDAKHEELEKAKERFYVVFYVKEGLPYQSFHHYATEDDAEVYALKQRGKHKNIISHEIKTMEVNNA